MKCWILDSIMYEVVFCGIFVAEFHIWTNKYKETLKELLNIKQYFFKLNFKDFHFGVRDSFIHIDDFHCTEIVLHTFISIRPSRVTGILVDKSIKFLLQW